MPSSYPYHRDPKTSNKIAWWFLISLFVTFFIAFVYLKLFGSKNNEATPKQLAQNYCKCLELNKNAKAQQKYNICNKELEKKNRLYKMYMDKINSDTLVVYDWKVENEVSTYIANFLKEVDKACP